MVIEPATVGGVPPTPVIEVLLAISSPPNLLEYILTLEPSSAWKLSVASTINTSTMTCLVGLSRLSIVVLIHSISVGEACTISELVLESITKEALLSAEEPSAPASRVEITSVNCFERISGFV